MGSNALRDISSEMEEDAIKRLFPLWYHERHLVDSVRPDAMPLGRARDTTIHQGPVSSADGSAFVKIGCTFWDDRLERSVFGAWESSLDGILVEIPVVAMNDDGRVAILSEENVEKMKKELVNIEKRKLKLNTIPFSLTCILHKNYVLADPTDEEESIIETQLTVVLDSSYQIVSLFKPGGPVFAYSSTIQECIALTRQRVNELQEILNKAVLPMEVDEVYAQ